MRINFFTSKLRVWLALSCTLRIKAPSFTSTGKTSGEFSALSLPTMKRTRTPPPGCSAGTRIHEQRSISRRGWLPLSRPSSSNGSPTAGCAVTASGRVAGKSFDGPAPFAWPLYASAPATTFKARPRCFRTETTSRSRQPSPHAAVTFGKWSSLCSRFFSCGLSFFLLPPPALLPPPPADLTPVKGSRMSLRWR